MKLQIALVLNKRGMIGGVIVYPFDAMLKIRFMKSTLYP